MTFFCWRARARVSAKTREKREEVESTLGRCARGEGRQSGAIFGLVRALANTSREEGGEKMNLPGLK
jgi:hypothetical protein